MIEKTVNFVINMTNGMHSALEMTMVARINA